MYVGMRRRILRNTMECEEIRQNKKNKENNKDDKGEKVVG